MEEMNAGKTDWQLVTYAHCGHAFTNPKSLEYNEVTAKERGDIRCCIWVRCGKGNKEVIQIRFSVSLKRELRLIRNLKMCSSV